LIDVTDSALAAGALVIDGQGNLYGTTAAFKFTPQGAIDQSFRVVGAYRSGSQFSSMHND
jgi:hypothetical protein